MRGSSSYIHCYFNSKLKAWCNVIGKWARSYVGGIHYRNVVRWTILVCIYRLVGERGYIDTVVHESDKLLVRHRSSLIVGVFTPVV